MNRLVFSGHAEMNFGYGQPVNVFHRRVEFHELVRRRNHAVLRIHANQAGAARAYFTFERRTEAGHVHRKTGIAFINPRTRINDDVIALREIRVRLVVVKRRDIGVAAFGSVVVVRLAAFQLFQISLHAR